MKKNDVKKLVGQLELYCKEHKARFTPPRRMTLEIIASSAKPIGAYDILDEMAKLLGNKPKPPTVYRAIDFLQAHGFIHKIESMNAFITCHAGHHHAGSQFIVCDDCGLVEEVHLCHLPKDLKSKVEAGGFAMSHWNTEIHGRCQACQA